jgi:hypothetical protein
MPASAVWLAAVVPLKPRSTVIVFVPLSVAQMYISSESISQTCPARNPSSGYVVTTLVADELMLDASLLRGSTVPDSSCRNVLSMTVAAVVIYFFFLSFFIGLAIFFLAFLASAIPLAV